MNVPRMPHGGCGGGGRSCNTRPVFALHAKVHVTIPEVLDAYEMCRHIQSADKRHEMYAHFGLDGEAVERYLDAVLQMERALKAASTS